MIIGNGFLAENLHYHGVNDLPLIVLAAGVGDSKCNSIWEFERETNLIIESIELAKKLDHPLIYFSSISADSESPYIKHKRSCEKIIQNSNAQHCIIRCPQLIGHNLNSHQLVGYLYQQILAQLEFNIFKNAERNILDIENLADFIKLWVKNPNYNLVSIGCEINIKVTELVSLIEDKINIKPNYNLIDSKLSTYSLEQYPSWKELELFGLGRQIPYKELIAKYL